MAQYRSYKDALQAISDIEFTGKGKYSSKSEFASRARYWSQSTFNKRVRQAEQNQHKREIRRMLIEAGMAPKTADSLKHISKKRAKEITRDLSQQQLNKIPKKRRRPLWVEWAQREDYPDWIEDLAHRINMENKFDINDKFGWATVYYWFMEDNMTIKDVLKYMSADIHDGNIYMYARQVQSQAKA